MSITATREFDAAVAEQFADRMVRVLNSAALALMTSVGHQVGLFDAMATLPPSTSRGHCRRGRRPGALRTRVAGRDDHRTRSSSTIRSKGPTGCRPSMRPASPAPPARTTWRT